MMARIPLAIIFTVSFLPTLSLTDSNPSSYFPVNNISSERLSSIFAFRLASTFEYRYGGHGAVCFENTYQHFAKSGSCSPEEPPTKNACRIGAVFVDPVMDWGS
jgi:hypothetical protein